MRCDERLRPRLLANIVLTGGNSLLPNLNVRLQKELAEMLPKNVNVRVRILKFENFAFLSFLLKVVLVTELLRLNFTQKLKIFFINTFILIFLRKLP
jgi:hypothetical protein